MNFLSRLFLLFCIIAFAASPIFAQRQIADAAKYGRLHPPGDLVPHIPYRSANIYYYDRPYNAGYAEQRGFQAGPNSAINARQPYSNQMFEQIFEEFERTAVIGQLGEKTGESTIDGFHDSVWRDKYLEYTDWQRHQLARQQWQNDKLEAGNVAPAEAADPMQNIRFQPLPFDNPQSFPTPNQSPVPVNENDFPAKSSQFNSMNNIEVVGPSLQQQPEQQPFEQRNQLPQVRSATSILMQPKVSLQNVEVVGPSPVDDRNANGAVSVLTQPTEMLPKPIERLDTPTEISSKPIGNLQIVGPSPTVEPQIYTTTEISPKPIGNLQIVGPSPTVPSQIIVQPDETLENSAPAKTRHRQASLLERLYEPKTFRPRLRN